MQPRDFSDLMQSLVDVDPGGRAGVATKLGVSASTISRWLTGKSRPHPVIEGKARYLMENHHTSTSVQEPLSLDGWYEPTEEEKLRDLITNLLSNIREILHRSGSYSSRHEALDEISKLLFAHTISLQVGKEGISSSLLLNSQSPAKSLRDFVSEIYSKHLPDSLSHELNASDFELHIKDSQNTFATEIINCFSDITDPNSLTMFSDPFGVDILNDVFGQFLADSFVQERELGQYLTPTEIVRFMTRVGINSLSMEDIDTLCHPEKCADFGVILDPSCGVSSFLREILRSLYNEVIRRHGTQGLKVWINNMVRSVLVGIDKSERMIQFSLTNLALFGSPAANLHFANSLVRSGPGATFTQCLEGKVKLILTNPPFGAEFPWNSLDKYKIATKWTQNKPKSLHSEILYMERYIDWLTEDGVLVAIVPDSILTNRGIYEQLRSSISPLISLRSVVSLPPVTFGAAGTTTKTSILHLKRQSNTHKKSKTYFSICQEVGYDVTTRDAQRRKVSNGRNDLVDILPEANREVETQIGKLLNLPSYVPRWDATYHAGLPRAISDRIRNIKKTDIFIKDVANLVGDRVDPRRSDPSSSFSYIEISDIDSKTLGVTAKSIRCSQAPSRARKLVRSNDVLVSTVRPERRTVGVVPPELNSAVCSTGFAVLRCTGIEPTVLARLLQLDFSSRQILRNNIGIAYPSISEECLLDILLPISSDDVEKLQKDAEKLCESKSELHRQELMFSNSLNEKVIYWQNA